MTRDSRFPKAGFQNLRECGILQAFEGMEKAQGVDRRELAPTQSAFAEITRRKAGEPLVLGCNQSGQHSSQLTLARQRVQKQTSISDLQSAGTPDDRGIRWVQL